MGLLIFRDEAYQRGGGGALTLLRRGPADSALLERNRLASRREPLRSPAAPARRARAEPRRRRTRSLRGRRAVPPAVTRHGAVHRPRDRPLPGGAHAGLRDV